MCGGDGGGGGLVCACGGGGVRLGFKVVYVREVDTVTPAQYMPFNQRTPQNLPHLSKILNF